MLRSYLAAALRNLVRNRVYSAVGILVLAVGLCAAILMALYIRAQWSYDRFIPEYERTYLSATVEALAGQAPIYDRKGPSWLAGLLKLKFSEIEAITRIADQDVRLRRGQIEAKEKIYWADRNMFDVLSLPVVAGDLRSALQRPDGIVLPRAVARKYFGRDDPVGQSIQIDRKHVMTVTAVVEDLPTNGTQLESGIFASGLASHSLLAEYDNDPQRTPGRGLSWDVLAYLRLAPNASIERLQNVMATSFQENLGPAPIPGLRAYPQFIRFDRVHVFPGLHPGKTEHFAMAAALGLLILFVAGAVFVNLSTARTAQRAPEVGIRKVCGANRRALILQFVGETLIQVTLATLVAVALVELLLPVLNTFTDVGAVFDYWRHPSLIAWVVLGALLTGVLVGFYPAYVLAAFRPADILRSSISSSSGALARHALVVLQFAILIGLIIVAGVIYRQRTYATHEALRVDADQVLLIRSTCNQTIRDELSALPGVRVATCSDLGLLSGVSFVNFKMKDGSQQAIGLTLTEQDVFDLYGLELVAGELPAESNNGDRSPQAIQQYLINESAIQWLGFRSPAAAVGQIIHLKIGDGTEDIGEIIGVVPDFSMRSIEQKIEPWIYQVTRPRHVYSLISVKLTGREIPETLTAIDKLLRQTGAAEPVERFFLNDYLQNLYRSVLRQAQMFAVFSCIAVLLACMGLVGLAASTIQRRTKEIGIRKAMGAGTNEVMRLLVWQFTKPVLWANLIAWPVAAFVMNRWLQGFAYHIDLSPWLFFVATALSLAIALLTVSVHCYLVAREKPVRALRYE